VRRGCCAHWFQSRNRRAQPNLLQNGHLVLRDKVEHPALGNQLGLGLPQAEAKVSKPRVGRGRARVFLELDDGRPLLGGEQLLDGRLVDVPRGSQDVLAEAVEDGRRSFVVRVAEEEEGLPKQLDRGDESPVLGGVPGYTWELVSRLSARLFERCSRKQAWYLEEVSMCGKEVSLQNTCPTR
jgi:hypothetical protein